MGRLFTVSLEGRIYTCKFCGTHLALHEDFVSKAFPVLSFNSKHKEAYVFNKVVNVTRGELIDRTRMTTGLNIGALIFCVGCAAMIGGTYGRTHENGQKNKEGKSFLDRSKLWLQGPRPNQEARVGGSDAADNA